MEVGIVGIDKPVAANMCLYLNVRWEDLRVSFPKFAEQLRGLDVVLEGSEDLTLGEQIKEVHKVWDGVLIAFATEASDHDLVAVLGQGPMTTSL